MTIRLETDYSRYLGVGYMGLCHGDEVKVKCNRCGILCTYRGPGQLRRWEKQLDKLEMARQFQYDQRAKDEGDSLK